MNVRRERNSGKSGREKTARDDSMHIDDDLNAFATLKLCPINDFKAFDLCSCNKNEQSTVSSLSPATTYCPSSTSQQFALDDNNLSSGQLLFVDGVDLLP